jgi:hypothetical protein
MWVRTCVLQAPRGLLGALRVRECMYHFIGGGVNASAGVYVCVSTCMWACLRKLLVYK